jgi:hypothetical protein
MTVEIRRAGDRFRTQRPGILSYHSFSAGPHYDSANLAFGPLIGYDEHLLAPGAGFAVHSHRGVDIITWVLDGVLTHEDSLGHQVILRSGDCAALRAGSGVRHEERNDGERPGRLLQATLLGAVGPPTYAAFTPPADVGSSHCALWGSGEHDVSIGETQLYHLFVACGQIFVDTLGCLERGDALRAVGSTAARVTVAPGALVQSWTLSTTWEDSPT